MADIYLKTKQDVKEFLEILVEESITKATHDVEKDKQQRLARDINKLKEADEEEKKKEADEEEKKKEAGDEEKKKEAGDEEPKPKAGEEDVAPSASPVEKKDVDIISAQSIIDKLNSIRSGKSLKDKKVNKAMVDYFNSLTPGEKTALNTFIRGLEDIIVGGETGKKTATEEDPGKTVDIEKTTPEEKSPSADTPPPGAEDTTPPIKVGEVQSEAMRRYAKSLMC